ncbi:MAG: hypothetical protein OXH11_15800, partial [Candidatus Aminicenantes bacterium]|nr:hypothetical protein [Candidatus Aminicenantes bacterium]
TDQVELDQAPVRSSRGGAFCDYDNDGDLDLLVLAIDDAPTLLRNDGGNRRNWLQFRLSGKRGNRSAIGARMKVVAASGAAGASCPRTISVSISAWVRRPPPTTSKFTGPVEDARF